jgi:hypothetical protein
LPMVAAVFSGIFTVISAIMAIVCGVGWWDDTKRGRRYD